MPNTTGDLDWNPQTRRWEARSGLGIAPYVPQGGGPVEAAPAPSRAELVDTRASMRAELKRQGLPIPAYLEVNELDAGGAELGAGGQQESSTSAEQGEAPTVVSLGSTRHLVEGRDVIDAEYSEPEQGEYAVDRLAELERRNRDTEPPSKP